MKKNTVPIVLFIVMFIAVYLAISFTVPGMRIKLDAEPMEYFIESIKHMTFFKSAVSFVVALFVLILSKVLSKKQQENSSL